MNAITRREACCLLCCIPPFAIAPLLGIREARAEEATAAALAAAEEQYAAVQVRIDELAAEHEALSFELAATLDAMEAKRGEIEATQTLIEATEAELQNCQSQLAEYIRTAYKNGATSELEVLLASADYEELFRNMYYLTKVSDSVTELIEHTREVARQLEEQKALLEEQHTQLDTCANSRNGSWAKSSSPRPRPTTCSTASTPRSKPSPSSTTRSCSHRRRPPPKPRRRLRREGRSTARPRQAPWSTPATQPPPPVRDTVRPGSPTC